ncbi:hypothetical protein RB594_002631 [Gaeumannomyces avenae]
MHARDASGRQVSLLNDDSSAPAHDVYSMPQRLSYTTASHVVSLPFYPSLARSASSSPNAPHLLRSDSYDSQASSEPLSPVTPNVMYADYGAHTAVYTPDTPYDDYLPDAPQAQGLKRPAAFGAGSRTSSYEDDSADSAGAAAPTDRSGKRYPCRYRDSHGCEKTFTTSGHASRHSKIHTAEKAVQCTHPGCSKKFTRADNMKQHLETHYKDRSRTSASRPSVAARRSSSSSKHGSGSGGHKRVDSNTPLPSPGIPGGAWDMRGLNLPLLHRPSPITNPSCGLDALAMAIACQEGA